jgi:hypothetical protein
MPSIIGGLTHLVKTTRYFIQIVIYFVVSLLLIMKINDFILIFVDNGR